MNKSDLHSDKLRQCKFCQEANGQMAGIGKSNGYCELSLTQSNFFLTVEAPINSSTYPS